MRMDVVEPPATGIERKRTRVTQGPKISADDCRSCGACCGPPYVADHYIDLTDTDVARLSTHYKRAHVKRGPPPALATKCTNDGVVCVALQGSLGTSVPCAIYEQRPDACRAFRPGSRACLRLRAQVGLT
jgi:uncharacterized protein